MSTNETKNTAYSYSGGKPPPAKPQTAAAAAAAKDAEANRGFPTPITRHPPGQITPRTFQKP